jgi:hypothetical protein
LQGKILFCYEKLSTGIDFFFLRLFACDGQSERDGFILNIYSEKKEEKL